MAVEISLGHVEMGTSIEKADLLNGEHLMLTNRANMVVPVKESGLARFAFDHYMALIGMKGEEAIGGKVHVTNWRVIFKSHMFNRVKGTHSIFLPNIRFVSEGINTLFIETNVQRFKFVMWFKQEMVDAINRARDSMSESGLETLKSELMQHPEVVASGLKKSASMNAVNSAFLGVRGAQSVIESLTGVERNAFVELCDLFEEGRNT